jgi:hypothetical protein
LENLRIVRKCGQSEQYVWFDGALLRLEDKMRISEIREEMVRLGVKPIDPNQTIIIEKRVWEKMVEIAERLKVPASMERRSGFAGTGARNEEAMIEAILIGAVVLLVIGLAVRHPLALWIVEILVMGAMLGLVKELFGVRGRLYGSIGRPRLRR